MSRVVVTLVPEEGEREIVESILGPVAWLVAGGDAEVGQEAQEVLEAQAALTFWPRSELRDAGRTWSDFPDLRVLQVATAGVNHIGWPDIPEQVTVCAAPGSSKEAVSEYVLGALITWARGFQRHTDAIRGGRFRLGSPAKALQELRVGLVGFGGIGQAVAGLLAPMGTQVRALNRSGQAPAGAPPVERVEAIDRLPDLASWCDVLVVCLPLTHATLGLVDAAVLDRMRDRDALLINVARGPVVDEDALYDWLQQGPARHWAHLDVWWKYPRDGHPFTRPFHELPNVTMTPHDAPNVAGFRRRMIEQAARQLRHWLDTGEALHVQDREAHLMDVEGDGRI